MGEEWNWGGGGMGEGWLKQRGVKSGARESGAWERGEGERGEGDKGESGMEEGQEGRLEQFIFVAPKTGYQHRSGPLKCGLSCTQAILKSTKVCFTVQNHS